MPARAETIRALARRVADGTIAFDPARRTPRPRCRRSQALPGIGDWTAEYIAMRALGEPDAFPSGDLVLRRVAGGCTARALDRRSEAWRPWRAYAVMLLWRSASEPITAATIESRKDRTRDDAPRIAFDPTAAALAAIALLLTPWLAAQRGDKSGRIVEIRSYNLKPGTRARFQHGSSQESLPMLQRWKVDVVAYGPSLHDTDFVLPDARLREPRGTAAQRGRVLRKRRVEEGPREAILADIENYTTLVLPLDEAAIQGLRGLLRPR